VRGPRVFNCRCVLPGQFIRGRITGASKAFYSGQAFEIVTTKGTRFSVTANHPVLTNRGWISAAQISKSDYLIHNPAMIDRLVIGNKVQHVPSRVEDVFRSFPQCNTLRVSKRWSRLDFHGDGGALQDEIEIVTATRRLLIEINSAFGESGGEVAFGRSYGEHLGLSSGGPAGAISPTRVGFVSSQSHAASRQAECKTATRNAKSSRKSKKRFAGLVSILEVIKRYCSFPAARFANWMPSLLKAASKSFALNAGSRGKYVDRRSSGVLCGDFVKVRDRLRVNQMGGFPYGSKSNQLSNSFPDNLSVSEPEAFANAFRRLSGPIASNNLIPIEGGVSPSSVCERTLFACASEFDASGDEGVFQGRPVDAHGFGDGLESLAIGIPNDQVQEIRSFHYEGPVYDFMTEDGLYAIGSESYSLAVVHNCTFTPIDKYELQSKTVQVQSRW